MDAFPSITNTITFTDKLELMDVTTSPRLVPISFAYNAEEIEKENANSPKLVPIKFAYADLEVADNEEADDDMNEDYYYDKREINIPDDDLDDIETFEKKIEKMNKEKIQDIDKEEKDGKYGEKSEKKVKKVINILKKKRDYNVENDVIEESEDVKKMIKKKKEDNVEYKIIEEEDIFDDVDSLFEEKSKDIIKDKEKGKDNARDTDPGESNGGQFL